MNFRRWIISCQSNCHLCIVETKCQRFQYCIKNTCAIRYSQIIRDSLINCEIIWCIIGSLIRCKICISYIKCVVCISRISYNNCMYITCCVNFPFRDIHSFVHINSFSADIFCSNHEIYFICIEVMFCYCNCCCLRIIEILTIMSFCIL